MPWKGGCEEAFKRKSERYRDLMQGKVRAGLAVGCRGFPAQSVWKLLTAVGLRESERKKAVRRLGEAAERASCWI